MAFRKDLANDDYKENIKRASNLEVGDKIVVTKGETEDMIFASEMVIVDDYIGDFGWRYFKVVDTGFYQDLPHVWNGDESKCVRKEIKNLESDVSERQLIEECPYYWQEYKVYDKDGNEKEFNYWYW